MIPVEFMKRYYLMVPIGVAAILLVLPYAIFSQDFTMIVSTDSMVPTLKPGDFLVVKRVEINEIKEGDIIAFDTHQEGSDVIAHRAIEVSESGGTLGIDTKGDYLDHPDLWVIYDEELIGIVTDVNPVIAILLAEPIRYLLVAIIVISGVILVKESIPKKKIEVKQLTCSRCDYSWFPRIIDGKVKIPDTCPNKNCRSPYWQTPRKKETE